MAGDNINDDKSNGSLAMGEGNMRTLRGAVEISKLVSKNRYDQRVLNIQNIQDHSS